MNTLTIARATALCVTASTMLLLSGCTTNPTTGARQFSGAGGGLSRDEEVSIGMTEGPKLAKEFGGEVQDARLRSYITEVGQSLKNHTEADGPTRAWQFTLLDSDIINAFALPGEKVFMSRGLADKLTTEAQLAGVLGHEIGHVMARHTSDRLAKAKWVGIGSQLLGAIAGATVKNPTAAQALPTLIDASGNVYVLGFSRDQESEADELGMRYMAKAGYNPKGQLEVMQVLQRESGGGGGIEWLATHPLPSTRIQRVGDLLKSQYAHTQSGPQAANFQEHTDRFRQRYLSIRQLSPDWNKPKKKAAVDGNGRTRLLSTINLDDPTSWCGICRAQAEAESRINIAP